ncbi:MAG: hypothetical protein U0984_09170 [Prosthecobacter sp.]|nr:hypothetical protein [Prosthecobacter sp.]
MSDFEHNVFINCPFDDGYMQLLRPLVFTVLHLGFTPRLALERADSGESRIDKIVELIQQSRYGIHDLSRCTASKKGEYSRLNMPLELGVDYACKLFKSGRSRTKRILILESERHRYKAALSDLSGSDITAHGNNPETLIVGVRNWMVQEASAPPTAAQQIYSDFLDFTAYNPKQLLKRGWKQEHIETMNIIELGKHMKDWIAKRQEQRDILGDLF